MKKCAKVFLISFIATFPLAGLVRTTYLTKSIAVEIASPYNSAHRMTEEHDSKEPAPVSTSHNHQETAGR